MEGWGKRMTYNAMWSFRLVLLGSGHPKSSSVPTCSGRSARESTRCSCTRSKSPTWTYARCCTRTLFSQVDLRCSRASETGYCWRSRSTWPRTQRSGWVERGYMVITAGSNWHPLSLTDSSTARAFVLDLDGRFDSGLPGHVQEDVDLQEGVRRGGPTGDSQENVLNILRSSSRTNLCTQYPARVSPILHRVLANLLKWYTRRRHRESKPRCGFFIIIN